MEPSGIPPANEGLSTFTCFSRLPLEIREMIWECLISVQRYLRIEGRLAKPTTIESFSISEGLYLSRVCSESRKVIFRITYQTAEIGDGASINRHLDVVLLTILDAPSLEILSSLTTNINCIAIPHLYVQQVKKLHLALQKRVAAGGRLIKVVYTGRRHSLQELYRPPGIHLMTPPADFIIMTNYGVPFLGLTRDFSARLVVDETEPQSFINATWSYDRTPKELYKTWKSLTSKDGIPAPAIKPSIIFLPVALG
ncbi:hypothetical protein FDENT_4122 [Fusarium denticulatum]|uniref:2EXR domain-containing protein n=1 Tax=Fusarium denticulatum TaxID=48507 RepID=A0A8H5UHY8_9HYPO|nr:hypothetical protein FDENT_4122 [Fusarium denticulatum]